MESHKTCVRKNNGFSLIEVIVVAAISVMILSAGIFYGIDSYRRNAFHAEVASIVSALERARSHALNNYFESAHGVCFDENKSNYIVFRGNTCVLGAAENEEIPANPNIAKESDFENTFPTIVFNELRANSAGGAINITDGTKNSTIKINSEGTIEW